MGDENNLPVEGTTSGITKPVSQPVEPEKAEQQATQQPLSEERVQQLIAEATQMAIDQAKDLGRRELQSQQDRNRAELLRAERRAQQAEARLNAYDGSVVNLDDESKTAIEQARLRGDNKYYQDLMKEEETRKQQETYANQLTQSLKEEATSLGIDPNDNRIDYALDESDYFKGRQRFTGSLSKIVKGNQDVASKQMQDAFKTMEANLRKELGLDVVPLSSGAAVDTSEATFIKEYNDGIRNSPSDHKRAQQHLKNIK